MSDYTVVYDISKTFLSILNKNMNDLVSSDRISLDSPADIEEDTLPGLSLYLYQIIENQYLKNQQMQPIDSTGLKYPPLALNLFYLLTAYAKDRDTEHQIIGRALQVFHNNSVVRGSLLQKNLSGTYDELTIVLNPLPIEDMNKLWNMFGNKPYKLSVTYRVFPALIDSTREIEADRVIKSTLNYNRRT